MASNTERVISVLKGMCTIQDADAIMECLVECGTFWCMLPSRLGLYTLHCSVKVGCLSV